MDSDPDPGPKPWLFKQVFDIKNYINYLKHWEKN